MEIDMLHFGLFLLVCILLGVLIFWRKELSNARLFSRRIPLRPITEEFQELLDEIPDTDIESKIRLLQAVMGNKIVVGVHSTSMNASIAYAFVEGIDGDKVLKNDKSIG